LIAKKNLSSYALGLREKKLIVVESQVALEKVYSGFILSILSLD
jgi:hypothetical protein